MNTNLSNITVNNSNIVLKNDMYFQKNILHNTHPLFVQGEFNWTQDPVIFNDYYGRIKTIIRVQDLSRIIFSDSSVTYSLGIITNKDMSLNLSDIKKLEGEDMKQFVNNSQSILRTITTFEPYYLILSLRKKGAEQSIIPEDADGVFEMVYCNPIGEYYKYITPENFIQGEFNFNYDPIQINDNYPYSIKSYICIDNVIGL